MKNKSKPVARPFESKEARFARINKNHSRFCVQLKSDTLGQFVDRAKDAIHATIESAMKVVDSLKICEWQIVGYNTYHKQWHTVLNGKPGAD